MLGKGSRRGFGCLDIRSVSGKYSSLFDPTRPISEVINEVTAHVRNVVNKAINEDKHGFKQIQATKGKDCKLPPMPIVSKAEFTKCIHNYTCNLGKLYAFQVLELGKGSNALNTFHNIFSSLRNQLANNVWVLGLPSRRIISNVKRRASPMILAVHKDQSYLSVFLSADWPRELTWRGAARQRINDSDVVERINDSDVVDAMCIALNGFLNYANRQGIKVTLIWPRNQTK